LFIRLLKKVTYQERYSKGSPLEQGMKGFFSFQSTSFGISFLLVPKQQLWKVFLLVPKQQFWKVFYTFLYVKEKVNIGKKVVNSGKRIFGHATFGTIIRNILFLQQMISKLI
jgi:hypothetical protein